VWTVTSRTIPRCLTCGGLGETDRIALDTLYVAAAASSVPFSPDPRSRYISRIVTIDLPFSPPCSQLSLYFFCVDCRLLTYGCTDCVSYGCLFGLGLLFSRKLTCAKRRYKPVCPLRGSRFLLGMLNGALDTAVGMGPFFFSGASRTNCEEDIQQ